MSLDQVKLYHMQAVAIWEKFCELHQDLLDKTFDEYSSLVSSDIHKLETITFEKNIIIDDIKKWEQHRQDLIASIEAIDHTSKIKNLTELLSFFNDYENQLPTKILRNLNELLIDIIEHLQKQNKKNQFFLNKAIVSLSEIKDSFKGKKIYSTYQANGHLNRQVTK